MKKKMKKKRMTEVLSLFRASIKIRSVDSNNKLNKLPRRSIDPLNDECREVKGLLLQIGADLHREAEELDLLDIAHVHDVDDLVGEDSETGSDGVNPVGAVLDEHLLHVVAECERDEVHQLIMTEVVASIGKKLVPALEDIVVHGKVFISKIQN